MAKFSQSAEPAEEPCGEPWLATGGVDLEVLTECVAQEPTMVALLSEAAGSTPRERGAWLAITPTRLLGTIGGGEAEHRTVQAARALLAEGGERGHLDLPLGPELDQCCGGRMGVTLVRVRQVPAAGVPLWPGGPTLGERARRPVVIYGAGHVGIALARALSPLPFEVTLIDGRSAELWPTPEDLSCRRLALPEAAAAKAPDEAAHLVMTHSHALDLEIVAAVLARRFAFLGLIGSATKRATFERRLRQRGLDPSPLTCPIGVPGIGGKEPAVIAAAAAAQLLTLQPLAVPSAAAQG